MRRSFITGLSTILLLSIFSLGYKAQAAEKYPVKPITFIVPLEPGSGGDVLVRPLCKKASEILRQPLIIVNKPGAGSSLGYRETHDAKPDGYTIGSATVTLLTCKMQGLMPYDHSDYTVMATYYSHPYNVIGATKSQRSFKTMEEVISFAKSHPGEILLSSAGVGHGFWITAVAFEEVSGLKFNIIPQPGVGGFIISQVAGGHADIGIIDFASAKPQIDAGNVRYLATFGDKRPPAPFDHVPTIKELGFDLSIGSFGSIIGPPKMPKDVTDKLVDVFRIAANDPEYHKFLIERFNVPFHLLPDRALSYMNEQRVLLRRMMDKAGILKEK